MKLDLMKVSDECYKHRNTSCRGCPFLEIIDDTTNYCQFKGKPRAWNFHAIQKAMEVLDD